MERIYFEINECAAKIARSMWSFSDYVPGSETASYKQEVDRIYNIGEGAISKGANVEKVQRICESFSKRYAEWKNKQYRIESYCPSVMICGAGNFPTKKKEKQNQMQENHHKLYDEIMQCENKIKKILNGSAIIKSGDEDAVQQLQKKVHELTAKQAKMKAYNAYYKKHQTLVGMNDLTEETALNFDLCIKDSWQNCPYAPYQLQNNNAKIKAAQKRLDELKKAKERETQEVKKEGFSIVENTEIMRVQVFFDEKPNKEVIQLMKKNGFRWAASQNAWQRQNTSNGIYAVKKVAAMLSEIL